MLSKIHIKWQALIIGSLLLSNLGCAVHISISKDIKRDIQNKAGSAGLTVTKTSYYYYNFSRIDLKDSVICHTNCDAIDDTIITIKNGVPLDLINVEVTIRRGKIEDTVFCWHKKDNKLISIIPFINGKVNGVVINYYLNGNVRSEWTVVNNVKHGIYRCYDYNGNMSSMGTFNKGRADGVDLSFDPISGEVRWISNSNNGKLNGTQYFFKNGVLDEIIIYNKGKIVRQGTH